MKHRLPALTIALLLIALPSAVAAQDKAKPPTPRGDMASWFPMNIYPPDAKRKGEQGRVIVQLAVDKSGSATACKVVESSGSASLDARTCELALANARFNPAWNTNGEPIDASYKLPGIRWTLMADRANLDLSEGAISNTRSIEIVVDAQGKGVSCRAIADASGSAGCASFQPGAQVTLPLLIRGRPVAGKVTITTTMLVEPK